VLALLCISLLALAMWCILGQAVPLSLPPLPPAPVALFFVCFQLPALSLAMLFSPAGRSDHVMRKTPRKRMLV
ncbi:unnamed protein product, partial [Symbiodinium microadriaticum]